MWYGRCLCFLPIEFLFFILLFPPLVSVLDRRWFHRLYIIRHETKKTTHLIASCRRLVMANLRRIPSATAGLNYIGLLPNETGISCIPITFSCCTAAHCLALHEQGSLL